MGNKGAFNVSELSTAILSVPPKDAIRCITCNQVTRCNYNLTGRLNPLCESCYLKNLPASEVLTQVKEVSDKSFGLIFRIFKSESKKFTVEVDEAYCDDPRCSRCRIAGALHHPLCDSTMKDIFDSEKEAEECIESFLRRI